MRRSLVAIAALSLSWPSLPAAANHVVIGSLTTLGGQPSQGVPVLPHEHFNHARRNNASGLCCFLSGGATAPVIVVQGAAPAPPVPAPTPAPAPQTYAAPTVERAEAGVTIVRGPPIPP